MRIRGIIGGWCLGAFLLAMVAGAGTATAGEKSAAAPPVDALVDQLRARLEREPADVDGWVLLARSYHYLGRFDESAAAFARARDLGYAGEAAAAPAASHTDMPAAASTAAPIHPAVMGRIATLAHPPAGAAAGQNKP